VHFFLNNQPDALTIQILFCYKTLHVSDILSAHHQEFSTAHSSLVSFTQVFDDRFQAESGWNFHPDSACKRNKICIISASGWLFKKKFKYVHWVFIIYRNIKVSNKYFEIVADFKYFRRTLTNRNFMCEEIKSRSHWKECLL